MLNTNDRPILKIKRTPSEWIWDVIGAGIFLSAIIYLVLSWSHLPNQVPGHYNGAGEVDRWGSKGELLILPIIGFFLWGFMTIFERFPHVHNYPARMNETNVRAFYLGSRKLLNSLKNICLIAFSYIIFQQIRGAYGESDSLGPWFLPVLIVATGLPIIWNIIKRSKI